MYSQPEHRQLPMKQLKRTGIYKASNVTFDPATCKAYSYSWWRFVDRIGGLVVFNDYGYSSSTRKHQSKVRRVLEALNIQVDVVVEAPKGLQDLQSAIAHYEAMIQKLISEIQKPGTRKTTNDRRRAQVMNYTDKIKVLSKLARKVRHEQA